MCRLSFLVNISFFCSFTMVYFSIYCCLCLFSTLGGNLYICTPKTSKRCTISPLLACFVYLFAFSWCIIFFANIQKISIVMTFFKKKITNHQKVILFFANAFLSPQNYAFFNQFLFYLKKIISYPYDNALYCKRICFSKQAIESYWNVIELHCNVIDLLCNVIESLNHLIESHCYVINLLYNLIDLLFNVIESLNHLIESHCYVIESHCNVIESHYNVIDLLYNIIDSHYYIIESLDKDFLGRYNRSLFFKNLFVCYPISKR